MILAQQNQGQSNFISPNQHAKKPIQAIFEQYHPRKKQQAEIGNDTLNSLEYDQQLGFNEFFLDSKNENQSSYDSHKQSESYSDNKIKKRDFIGQIQPTKEVYSIYYSDFFLVAGENPDNVFKRFSTLINHYGTTLLQNNIEICQQFDNSIKLVSASKCWKVMTFSVHLGYFNIKVDLINFEDQKQFEEYILQMGTAIGSGAEGKIYQFDGSCVMKQLAFKQNYNELYYIEQYLKQYAFQKLLSCLEIGPKVMRPLGFDVLCAKKSFIFFMQECESTTYCFNRLNIEIAEQEVILNKLIIDLKSSLYNLHLIQIVHYDIKPSNIMYSPQFDKFVFIDFGLSELKIFRQGFVEKQKYKGTFNYCSNEMKQLCFSGPQNESFVDAYYNDCVCLHNTLRHIQYSFRVIIKFQKKLIGKKQSDSLIPVNDSDGRDKINNKEIEKLKELSKLSESQDLSQASMGHIGSPTKKFAPINNSQKDASKGHDFEEYDFTSQKIRQHMENMIQLTYFARTRNQKQVQKFLENRPKWVQIYAQQICQIFMQLDVYFPNQLQFLGNLLPTFCSQNTKELFELSNKTLDSCALNSNAFALKTKKRSELKILYTTSDEMQRQSHFNYIQQNYVKANANILSTNRQKFIIFSSGQDYKTENASSRKFFRQFWLMQKSIVKIDKIQRKYLLFSYFLNYLAFIVAKPQLLIQHLTQFNQLVSSIASDFPQLDKILQSIKPDQIKSQKFIHFIGNLRNAVKSIINEIYSEHSLKNLSELKSGLTLILLLLKCIKYLVSILNLSLEYQDIINNCEQLISNISLQKVIILKKNLNIFLHKDVNNQQIETLFQSKLQIIGQIYQIFQNFYSQSFSSLFKTGLFPQPFRIIEIVKSLQAKVSLITEKYDGMPRLAKKIYEESTMLYEKWRKKTDFQYLFKVFQILYHRKLILLQVPQVKHMITVFRMSANFILIKLQYLESKPVIVYEHIEAMKTHLAFAQKNFSKLSLMLQQQKIILDFELLKTEIQILRKMGRLVQMSKKLQEYFDKKQGSFDDETGLMKESQMELWLRRLLCIAYSELGLDKRIRQCKKSLVSQLQKTADKFRHKSLNDYDESLEGIDENVNLNKTNIAKESFNSLNKIFGGQQKISMDKERNLRILFHEIKISVKDESVKSFKNLSQKITENRDKIVVEFEQKQQIQHRKQQQSLQVEQAKQILLIKIECMDSIYKSFDSVATVFEVHYSTYSLHVIIVLIFILIQRINHLTKSILVNQLFVGFSVEKSANIDLIQPDKLQEKLVIVEVFVLIQYVDSIFELCSQQLNDIKRQPNQFNNFLFKFSLELKLKSNQLIQSLMGKQNYVDYPLLYWKNAKDLAIDSQIYLNNQIYLNQSQSLSSSTTPKKNFSSKIQFPNSNIVSFMAYLKKNNSISSFDEWLTVDFMTRCKQHLEFGLRIFFQHLNKLICEVKDLSVPPKIFQSKQLSLIVFMRQLSSAQDVTNKFSEQRTEFMSICTTFEKLSQHIIKQCMAQMFLINHQVTKMTTFLIKKHLAYCQYQSYTNLMVSIAQIVDLFGHESKLIRDSFWKSCVQESLAAIKDFNQVILIRFQDEGKMLGQVNTGKLFYEFQVTEAYKILIEHCWPAAKARISSNAYCLSLIPFALALSIIESIDQKTAPFRTSFQTSDQKQNHLIVQQSLYGIIKQIMCFAFSKISRIMVQEVVQKVKYWKVLQMWYKCRLRLQVDPQLKDRIEQKLRWLRVLTISKTKHRILAQFEIYQQSKRKQCQKQAQIHMMMQIKLLRKNQFH